MAKTCLFLLISAAAAACTFDTAGAPAGDDDLPSADASGDDPPVDARPPVIDAPALAIDAPAPIDAAQPVVAPPGAACTCDADCAADEGHPGVCIYGVCMTRASGTCAAGGSQTECPDGSRCWNLSGDNVGPLCWPDCDAHSCSGTCDSDNSCIPAQDQDCLGTCSTACSP